MLKNASTLAIVGLDTAENGPSKVRQVTNRIDAIIGYREGTLGGCVVALRRRRRPPPIHRDIQTVGNSAFRGSECCAKRPIPFR